MINDLHILIADDDSEDRMLMIDALRDINLKNNVQYVENGEELMQYIQNKGKYASKDKYPLPGLILLDLNMPKMDGREALKEIKQDRNLCSIPLIIFTTSSNNLDVQLAYRFGANSYISKPVSYDAMITVMKSITDYWFETVQLPTNR